MIEPSKDNAFCFYPFYALVFKLYDQNDLKAVAPCCMMHDTRSKESGKFNSVLSKKELKGLTPQEIFNHEKFEKLRNNLLNNIKDERCSTCWNLEDKGILSHRLYTRWQFPEKFNADLKEVDISLSNKCNLACRMCNTGSSHQIWKDVDELKKTDKLNLYEQASKNSLRSHNLPQNIKNNYLIQWIYNNTDKVKIFKASGGEPLYDNNILNLLRKFVKDGNSKNTELALHTNGVLITDKIIDLMNQFKIQRHSFSIDGVDSTYDYIRHKSDFTTLERNIKQWFKKSTNVYALNINLVVSALNIGNVVDFLEWTSLMFHDKVRCNVFMSEVRPHGRGIDIANLPNDYLMKVKQDILNFKSEFEKFRTKKYDYMHKGNYFHYEIDKVLSLIEHSIEYKDKNIKNLYDEIVLLDETRGQSYKNFLNSDLIDILDDYKRTIN